MVPNRGCHCLVLLIAASDGGIVLRELDVTP